MVWASLILCDCRCVVIPWTPNKVKLTPSCSMAIRRKRWYEKILLLSTLVIILLGSIIYINYSTQLNVDYRNEGIIIQYPFNQLHINKDALSAFSDTHLISAYYYMNNKNMDDYHSSL